MRTGSFPARFLQCGNSSNGGTTCRPPRRRRLLPGGRLRTWPLHIAREDETGSHDPLVQTLVERFPVNEEFPLVFRFRRGILLFFLWRGLARRAAGVVVVR